MSGKRRSWKTTVAGLITLLMLAGPQVQLLLDGNASTNPDWAIMAAGVSAFIGLLKARDNDVSSEEAGAK